MEPVTLGRLDTAPRVLKTRDDGSEPDDENEGRHKHLDQRHSGRHPAHDERRFHDSPP